MQKSNFVRSPASKKQVRNRQNSGKIDLGPTKLSEITPIIVAVVVVLVAVTVVVVIKLIVVVAKETGHKQVRNGSETGQKRARNMAEACQMNIARFVKTTSKQCAANDTHLLQVQGLVVEHHQPQQGARHLQPGHFQQGSHQKA